MSEEEKLEAIKKELEKTNEHLSWLSAWLVKLPVTFGVIWLIAVLWPTDCKTTERESRPQPDVNNDMHLDGP